VIGVGDAKGVIGIVPLEQLVSQRAYSAIVASMASGLEVGLGYAELGVQRTARIPKLKQLTRAALGRRH
jgi:hypothetical protein